MIYILLVVGVFLALLACLLECYLTLAEMRIDVADAVRDLERIALGCEPVQNVEIRCAISTLKGHFRD